MKSSPALNRNKSAKTSKAQHTRHASAYQTDMLGWKQDRTATHATITSWGSDNPKANNAFTTNKQRELADNQARFFSFSFASGAKHLQKNQKHLRTDERKAVLCQVLFYDSNTRTGNMLVTATRFRRIQSLERNSINNLHHIDMTSEK